MLGQGDISLDGEECASAVSCHTFEREDAEPLRLAEAIENILHFLPFHEHVVCHLWDLGDPAGDAGRTRLSDPGPDN